MVVVMVATSLSGRGCRVHSYSSIAVAGAVTSFGKVGTIGLGAWTYRRHIQLDGLRRHSIV
jgi:hypothetical protein